MSSTGVDAKFIADLKDLRHVGRYTILRELGRGGMAVVYQARDPYIQRLVAIKMARPETNEERAHFFVEAQSAGRLMHPNIMAVYDAGVHKGFCYIAMEYIEGYTLDRHVRRPDLLSGKKAAEIMFKVLTALDYAHKQGVIHRDIKPSNIMLTSKGEPKITDFGIARIKGAITQNLILGTLGYMSPEQLKGEALKDNTDIFSAGIVLYELLTGKAPFHAVDEDTIMKRIVNDDPDPVRSVVPNLPPVMDEILEKALCKDPESRYQSALDFAYDLRVALRVMEGAEPITGKPKSALQYLRHVPFFRDFTERQLEELYLAASVEKVKKGSVIMNEGEIDDTFYIILSGEVSIKRSGETIAQVGVGECFGEMGYIGGQARVATVTAEKDCLLMRISATLLDRAPGPIQLLFFKNFAQFLVQRFSMFFKKEKS